MKVLVATALLYVAPQIFFSPSVAHAQATSGRILGDIMPKETFEERVPVPSEERRVERREERIAAHEEPGWGVRFSPGVTVWFFSEEDNDVGPAGYFDFWNKEYPINFRVGIEGSHMDLEQEHAQAFAETPDDDPRISFYRIPFAIEYIAHVADDTALFLGAGPDIIHTANDNEDTNVGVHVGARLAYNFNPHWGVAVEGGYFWAEVDSSGGKIDLDAAYITPLITYTF